MGTTAQRLLEVNRMRFVIIGGVAGGMSAATRLRRLNEDADIIVIDKGPYVSFANCGLPYYLSHTVSPRSALLVKTAEQLKQRFALDIRPDSEVVGIDANAQQITVVPLTGEHYVLDYDKLLISPGMRAQLPFEIDELSNTFTLRTVPDADRIMQFLEEHHPKTATIVGGGFIGLELCDNLVKRGVSVNLVEMQSHVMPKMDPEMAAFLNQELRKHGVNVYLNRAVDRIDPGRRQVTIKDHDGQTTQLTSELVIIATGTVPNTEFVKDAGIKVDQAGFIKVDDHFKTSCTNIFAIGDAIMVPQQSTKQPTSVALAGPANRQGRLVADVMSGRDKQSRGRTGTAVVKVFEKTAASTGLTETQLKQIKRKYRVVHFSGMNHVGYYPDAFRIELKLIFDGDNGAILGAQGVAPLNADVERRIDVISTAIKAQMTVADLIELDLAYAPPYGSAKDPVNMVGYEAENIMTGLSDSIQWNELDQYRDCAFLLDVRSVAEYEAGHIRGFKNIALDDLRSNLTKLPKDQLIIVSCLSGQRSYLAERILKQHGFKTKNLDGAFHLYSTVVPQEIVTESDKNN